MEPRRIRLYGRPACTLCVEADAIVAEIVAASHGSAVLERVDVEEDPLLHARLFADIPALEVDGRLLTHATSRRRIEAFLADSRRPAAP